MNYSNKLQKPVWIEKSKKFTETIETREIYRPRASIHIS